jgi:hypothetical protein
MKRPRKPTGQDGVVRLGAYDTEYRSRTLPDVKEDIELLVARKFAAFRSSRRMFAFEMLGEPVQNPTDDFDFTLNTTLGPKYLELMECHFAGVGSYLPSGQYSYEPFTVAECLSASVKKKSERYRGATDRGIVLLTYTTHWEFALSNAVFWLVAHRMHRDPVVFESIYHIMLSDLEVTDVTLLFPANVDYSQFDPEKYRHNVDILLNPAAFKITREPSG